MFYAYGETQFFLLRNEHKRSYKKPVAVIFVFIIHEDTPTPSLQLNSTYSKAKDRIILKVGFTPQRTLHFHYKDQPVTAV